MSGATPSRLLFGPRATSSTGAVADPLIAPRSPRTSHTRPDRPNLRSEPRSMQTPHPGTCGAPMPRPELPAELTSAWTRRRAAAGPRSGHTPAPQTRTPAGAAAPRATAAGRPPPRPPARRPATASARWPISSERARPARRGTRATAGAAGARGRQQALPSDGRRGESRRAPDHRRHDVPRDGNGLLAGASRRGIEEQGLNLLRSRPDPATSVG